MLALKKVTSGRDFGRDGVRNLLIKMLTIKKLCSVCLGWMREWLEAMGIILG